MAQLLEDEELFTDKHDRKKAERIDIPKINKAGGDTYYQGVTYNGIPHDLIFPEGPFGQLTRAILSANQYRQNPAACLPNAISLVRYLAGGSITTYEYDSLSSCMVLIDKLWRQLNTRLVPVFR